MPQPTIGRSVHFFAPMSEGGEMYAAIITRVHAGGELVDLVSFGPNSLYFHHDVRFSGEPGEDKAGCWSWPARVE